MRGRPAAPGQAAKATKDKDYLIWFLEQCLNNALRLETYIQDSEREGDAAVADLFGSAQGASRKGVEEGKALLGEHITR